MNDIQDMLFNPNNTLVSLTAISAIGIGLAVGYSILSIYRSPKPKNIKKTSKKAETTSSVEDSEDNVILKGYKETSDGKKTSYFHRELSEEEKSLIGDTTPKRIDGSNQSIDNTPQRLPKSLSGSPWNSAGTYEEKDISSWAFPKLTKLFSDIQYTVDGKDINDSTSKSCSVAVTNVTNVDGDALVTVARGKKRFVLDLRADIEWKVLYIIMVSYLTISPKQAICSFLAMAG